MERGSISGMSAAAGESRRGALYLTILPVAVLVAVSAVFAVDDGSWYGFFKLMHVVFAVLWVGGAAALSIMAISAELANDPERLFSLARNAELVGQRVFLPSTFLVFGFGVAMVENGNLGYGDFWISFALAAWAISALVGAAFFGPQLKRLNQLIEERGKDDPEVERRVRTILRVGRFDACLLLLIVVDMTVKPF
jgi:uncharacterized membrane protein